MNRFVIHKHTRNGNTHWDLMLQWPDSDKLKTWRIDTPPQDWHVGLVKAEKIFDHDKKFLTYQGPVNNGQGEVKIVDEGRCEIISETPHKIGLSLKGKTINCQFTPPK